MLVQVGGHPGTVHDHGAWVIKSCLETEAMFYHATYHTDPDEEAALIRAKNALQDYLPACVGIADPQGVWLSGWPTHASTPPPIPGAYSIALENLTAPFRHANVCDIKLGTILYNETNPMISDEKRERMQRKAQETTSAEFGLRITGWCTYDAATDTMHRTDKQPGRAARTKSDVARLLIDALQLKDARYARIVREAMLPRLDALRTSLQSIPVQLRSTSVLLVMEGDPVSLNRGRTSPPVDVRLIDLAHSHWSNTPDEGVQRGLNLLYELCRDLCTQLLG